jgi:hypothetical protein
MGETASKFLVNMHEEDDKQRASNITIKNEENLTFTSTRQH